MSNKKVEEPTKVSPKPNWGTGFPVIRIEIKIAKQELSNAKNLLDSKISDLYFESIKLFYYIQASYQEIKVAKKSDISIKSSVLRPFSITDGQLIMRGTLVPVSSSLPLPP